MLGDPRSRTTLSRVELVPIRAIASLVELGVHPHAIGVTEAIHVRIAAWSSAEPRLERTPPAAYVERPALELALLAQCLRLRHVELHVTDYVTARVEATALADSGAIVIDASGREAALATRRVRAPRPWVARLFNVPVRPWRSAGPFMIASLPQGYAFRAGGHSSCTVGVVGRGPWLAGSGAEVRERLSRTEARWLVQDLEALPWACLGAKAASTQWADSDAVASVGDAGLARDALSSQGLASGLKDARYASLVRTPAQREDLAHRRHLARVAHSATLAQMIDACRWRAEPTWSSYRTFLELSAQSPGLPN